MKLQGEHELKAPREEVWEAVMDPAVIQSIMPGCEDLKATGEHQFEGTLKIKVGPVQGKFKGSVELSDLDPPESYHLHIKGKGAPGFVDGQGTMRLEAASPATTTLHYEIDAKVGGRIASVGQRLLDSSARVIARQSLEGLAQQIESRGQPQPEEGVSEAVPAEAGGEQAAHPERTPRPRLAPQPPSQARFAADFAKGLVEELVPEERRPAALAVGAGVLLALVLLIVKACGS